MWTAGAFWKTERKPSTDVLAFDLRCRAQDARSKAPWGGGGDGGRSGLQQTCVD